LGEKSTLHKDAGSLGGRPLLPLGSSTLMSIVIFPSPSRLSAKCREASFRFVRRDGWLRVHVLIRELLRTSPLCNIGGYCSVSPVPYCCCESGGRTPVVRCREASSVDNPNGSYYERVAERAGLGRHVCTTLEADSRCVDWAEIILTHLWVVVTL
jgi:hypothetical protein